MNKVTNKYHPTKKIWKMKREKDEKFLIKYTKNNRNTSKKI